MSMEAIIQRFSGSLLDPTQFYPQINLPYYEVDGVEAHRSLSSTSSSSSSPTSSEGSFTPEEGDFSDATLKLIDQMLMQEDDLENNQDYLALQATEKSFYDVLGQKSPISPGGSYQSTSRASPTTGDNLDWVGEREKREFDAYSDYTFQSILQSISSPGGSAADARRTEKKTHDREDNDDGRSNKQLAPSSEDSDAQLDMFDDLFQCPRLNPHGECGENASASEEKPTKNVKVGRKGRGTKTKQKGNTKEITKGNTKEVVDLRTLLSQCAQAVARADLRSANELLNRIRKHSTPLGDGTERLAHYFANALEARLAGTGASLYSSFTAKRIPAADILKGYEIYVRACPYNKASNLLANRTIGKLATKGQTLHIIDFGILYGFQWPCLIQQFSKRPEGPPNLRITGIEFPQPGFRPAERVEETGRQLARYCQKLNVPFEYNAIASKWELIKIEDLKIREDEIVVVNSMYRMRNVPDETMVEKNSPRDMVLDLARRIKPDIFIMGALNGTYNAPFFVTRFREALFHFSAGFDMFDARVGREEKYRMLFEQEVYGRDIMNVVACEGADRVERPETYKQWQVRILRAGFRQVAPDQEILKDVCKVKSHYHKDFVVDVDGNWVLQGWKGRITNVISCWKPV